jgi:hypothetical protein
LFTTEQVLASEERCCSIELVRAIAQAVPTSVSHGGDLGLIHGSSYTLCGRQSDTRAQFSPSSSVLHSQTFHQCPILIYAMPRTASRVQ